MWEIIIVLIIVAILILDSFLFTKYMSKIRIQA